MRSAPETHPRALPPHGEAYLDYLAVERGLSAHSLSAYRRDLTVYAAFLEETGIDDPAAADRHQVTAFAGWLRRQRTERGTPYAESSVARTLVTVRGFHRFLAKEGHARTDAASDLATPKATRALPKALSLQQVETLLDAPTGDDPAALRDAALLELLYSAGLRITELVQCDVDDVDLIERTVRCRGKGSRERIVPVGRVAAEAVDAWLVRGRPAVEPTTPALFTNLRGRRLTRQGGWKIVKRHADAVGLGDIVSPHTLRHSFATHMVDGGADVRVVQELLGHASVNTTQVYTKVSRARLQRLYDRTHPRAS